MSAVGAAAYYNSFINIDARQTPVAATTTTTQHSPVEPPPGVPYAEFLRGWTDAHVARWLADLKCECYEEAFKSNDIRGDIILELDKDTLVEMGISSIGDRLRIIRAVKQLRQRATGRLSVTIRVNDVDSKPDAYPKRRLDARPAPLTIHPTVNKGELPDLANDQTPESAKLQPPTVRPLPQQPTPSTNSQLNTPISAHPMSSYARQNTKLPVVPPQPREKPPPPPPPATRSKRILPLPSAEPPSNPPPPPPQGQMPQRSGQQRPVLPVNRSISPISAARPSVGRLHVRNPSSGSERNTTSPAKTGGRHPYANVQGPGPVILSPIDESFTHQSSTTPPSNPSFAVGRGPFNPVVVAPSAGFNLDGRKLIKFLVPEDMLSFVLDVTTCVGGAEILEKVVKKYGKNRGDNNLEVTQTDDGGLVVDGWGVFLDMSQDDNVNPLGEADILAICHSPDHPARETGLVLRKVRDPPMSKRVKRASTVSILSGLGVPSPTESVAAQNAKHRSKLRNFFGHRPPSELITTHLTEYFPNTEKKVLARTQRNSMLLRSGTIASRRNSTASSRELPSRFSTSTAGSASGRRSYSPSRSSIITMPPPVPEKPNAFDTTEDLPRVSISTEDGRMVDLHIDSAAATSSKNPQLLPPIPFPTESLSETMDDFAGYRPGRSSRASSIASRRMSYMTELRSKRDKSDTASMMTVDEITANVENLRHSPSPDSSAVDGWTKVDDDSMIPTAVDTEDEVSESDAETDALDTEDEDTLHEDGLSLDVDENGDLDGVAGAKRVANKWIKGALIGAGSFGKVYLGMDASTGFLMAVKQVELPKGNGPSQERKKSMLSALEREIELLKNLEHENIVQYLYSSLDDEFLNIFLEYVPGGSITSLLSNYGAFEEPLVKNFVRQILQGLNYLHERDIIHRDIKGANILVDNKGGVKISDFGISKKVDDNLLAGNRLHRPSLQGSVFWMAPEVVKQSVHTRKADIWSVGCLVVEMLTGQHPWAQLTQMQAIFKIGSSAKPEIPSDISAEAQDFLQRTFEINHEARPSASELLQHSWVAVKPS